MAKTKKEEVVESTTKQEQPKIDNEVGKIKIKPKVKKFKKEDIPVKLDLSKKTIEEKPEEKVEKNIEEEIEKAMYDLGVGSNYSGAGQSFSHDYSYYRRGTRVLVTQTGGLDI